MHQDQKKELGSLQTPSRAYSVLEVQCPLVIMGLDNSLHPAGS